MHERPVFLGGGECRDDACASVQLVLAREEPVVEVSIASSIVAASEACVRLLDRDFGEIERRD